MVERLVVLMAVQKVVQKAVQKVGQLELLMVAQKADWWVQRMVAQMVVTWVAL